MRRTRTWGRIPIPRDLGTGTIWSLGHMVFGFRDFCMPLMMIMLYMRDPLKSRIKIVKKVQIYMIFKILIMFLHVLNDEQQTEKKRIMNSSFWLCPSSSRIVAFTKIHDSWAYSLFIIFLNCKNFLYLCVGQQMLKSLVVIRSNSEIPKTWERVILNENLHFIRFSNLSYMRSNFLTMWVQAI